jgi:hypothetical protein
MVVTAPTTENEIKTYEKRVGADRYKAIAANFDNLPDAAIIPDRAVAIVLHTSIWTLKRWNPTPRYRLSPRTGGRRVGDIRALRGVGQPASPAPPDTS